MRITVPTMSNFLLTNCFSVLVLSGMFVTTTPRQWSSCSLSTSMHLDLDSSSSTWWLGLSKEQQKYRVSDPPATVMSVLTSQDANPGELLQNPFYEMKLKSILANQTMISLFNQPWYYTILFKSPKNSAGCKATLTFKGVNYKGNVEFNGQRIVPRGEDGRLVGTLRYFDFDLSSLSDSENNVLSVKLLRPHDWPMEPNSTDLAMPFLDWNPEPPDGNLGLWRGIELTVFPATPVSIRYPAVNLLNLPDENDTCQIECIAEVFNVDQNRSHEGSVKFTFEWNTLHSRTPLSASSSIISVRPQTAITVVVNVSVPNCADRLWWPWQMGTHEKDGNFYKSKTHNLSAVFQLRSFSNSPSMISDSLQTTFGLRQITKTLVTVGPGFQPSSSAPNMTTSSLFYINGKRLMVRGGGFASDLFLRTKNVPVDLQTHVQLVQQLGLNSIRLEGQFIDDALFHYADQYGILIIPGIVCCDAWQHWDLWSTEQHIIAKNSLRSQARRIRIHPSSFFFLISSDELPPVEVEHSYLEVLRESRWRNPTLSSAGSWVSTVSGPTGAKMTGPYAWVPPNYWTDREAKRFYGGASGFIAETSPGASVLTMESVNAIISPKNQWDSGSTVPNKFWTWHTGSETGRFGTLDWFTPAMNSRMGPSHSANEFACKSQFMTYESHRAMMEAYSMNKYGGGNDEYTSTGVIQWMLNSAWPSNIWHLYDYYGVGGGSFYGIKKATNFPLHLAFDYKSLSIKLINSGYKSYNRIGLNASVALHRVSDGKQLASLAVKLPDILPSDATIEVLSRIPDDWMGLYNGTLLLRLKLETVDAFYGHNKQGGPPIIDISTYALPSNNRAQDIVDFNSCNYFRCNLSSYANMTDLQHLPMVVVNFDLNVSETGAISVVLKNGHDDRIAFLVSIASVVFSDRQTLNTLVWSENYVTLLPLEHRVVSATIPSNIWKKKIEKNATVDMIRLQVLNNCSS